mmetsp:Transcript_86619/g.242646  ORF Transcript_86619/g.242646 Transcript_86619/m.242646 type:complete len:470 (-) Transcript_86619:119-1528(-)
MSTSPFIAPDLRGTGVAIKGVVPGTRLWHVRELFSLFVGQKCPDVFGNIQLAEGGGLGDVTREKLLYPLQYFYAAQTVLFILLNIKYVVASDLTCAAVGHCVTAAGAENEVEHGFTISRQLLMPLFGPIPAERVVSWIELVFLIALLSRLVRLILQASLCESILLRWVSVSEIFLEIVPQLSCYSALRVLYYVHPTVIGTEAYYVVVFTMERLQRETPSIGTLAPLCWYVATRLLCLCVGFDAFLVKLRLASGYIKSPDLTMVNAFSMIMVLFQIMGVVNLNWFVRRRLFIFTFGAENGDMSNAHKARETVWNMLLCKRIYETFTLFEFVVVMLGFDDYDFQTLVWDERVRDSEPESGRGFFSRAPVPKCSDGHPLQAIIAPTGHRECRSCRTRFKEGDTIWACRARISKHSKATCTFEACDNCKVRRQKEDPMLDHPLADWKSLVDVGKEGGLGAAIETMLLRLSLHS